MTSLTDGVRTTPASVLHRHGTWTASDCLQILRRQPDHFEAHSFLGSLYLEKRDWRKAAEHLGTAFKIRPANASLAQNWALALHESGNLDAAVNAYQSALSLDARSPETLFNLGNALLALRRFPDAETAFQQAITLRPDFVEAIHNLGESARLRGDFPAAAENYRRATTVRPDFFPSHNNLAVLQMQSGDFAAAIESFQAARRIAPNAVEPVVNLALCLAQLGRLDEALEICRIASRSAPHHPLLLESLGRIHQAMGRCDDARSAFRRSLEQKPGNVAVRCLMAELELQSGDIDAATRSFLAAANCSRNHEPAWIGMARAAQLADDAQAAEAIFERLAVRSADAPLWRLRSASVCPTVFPSEQAIDEYRASLADAVHACRDNPRRYTLDDMLRVGLMPPFNLPFHGRDDKPIKSAFGDFVSESLGECSQVPVNPPYRSRPRVGFVCTGNETAFVRSIGGLIARLDPDALEISVVCLSTGRTNLDRAFEHTSVNRTVLPPSPADMVAQLRSAQFDLLYYFEVGTSPLGYLLAAHRLAAVQCATWGVQVTSGLPTIDYYISTRLAESDQAQSHYREELLLLDTMLSWQTRRPTPANVPNRAALGLPIDGNIYLCPQQIGKFTPSFDPFLAAILRRDPKGVLVITEGTTPILARRLAHRFQTNLPDVAGRVLFLPQQVGAAYFHLLRAADVLLDPIAFGGVNTTYDALSLGKSIVTLPSPYQRGRYTLGCYRLMDLCDCVAESADDYIAAAVRIATDPDYRLSLEREIDERSGALFENHRSADELQSALLGLCARGGGRP